jgi:O-antigen/teichoic acid export membrane protein
MCGLFINNVFTAYASLLDGLQKYYQRSIIQISGWIIFVTLSVFLVPVWGLKGVAFSFFIQSIWQLIGAMITVSGTGLFRSGVVLCFDKKSFQLVTAFGIKSQTISILVIFFDPLVKFFITKYVGLYATANYELANKIVMQVRNILVNANQVIIPKMVIYRKAGTENSYFNSILARNILMSVFAGLFVIILSPLAILFFSGKFDSSLMAAVIIINFGWMCNTITSLHYYTCTSFDRQGRIIVYHTILAVVVAICYALLSYFTTSELLYYSVPSFALFIGSVYISHTLSDVIQKSFLWLRSPSFLYFITASALLLPTLSSNIVSVYIIIIVLFLAFSVWAWRNYKQTAYLEKETANEERENISITK